MDRASHNGIKVKISKILGLSYSLAKANFKLKNEGSYLGILWYLLSPLALFSIILFVRGAAFSKNIIPLYPLYLLFGLMIYNFFNQIISSSVTAIDSNASFIKSIKISQEALVISIVVQGVFSHFFEIILVSLLMLYFKVSLLGLFFYPAILLFQVMFLTGISLGFSVLGVYINDLKNIWTIFTSLLLFITPTFYALTPGSLHYTLNLFNPLFYFITLTRDVVIYNKTPTPTLILTTISFSLISLIAGMLIFSKFKKKFAELI